MRAYRRRWARLAWHVAALGRTNEIPDLDEVTGEALDRERPAQSPEMMMHNIRLHRAALSRKVH